MNKHKKTRQQKIISQLRNQLHKKESTLSFSPAIATASSLSPFGRNISKSNSLPVNPSTPRTPSIVTTTISRDLLKTTLITTTIISLELILYFLLEGR